MSTLVQNDDTDVSVGDIYATLSADDPDPEILWEYASNDNDGVLFHVLGMKRGKSVSEGGELFTYAYDDPDAPPEAWTTYNYVVVCPEHNTDLPYKLLLTKTGKPAAQIINLVLTKTSAQGPAFNQAFRLTTSQKENKKGKYFVPLVSHVDADKDHVDAAARLAVMVDSDPAAAQATGEEPAI